MHFIPSRREKLRPGVSSMRSRYQSAREGKTASIRVTLDDRSNVLPVAQADVVEGALFDRFGLFNMQSGGHHVQMFIDELNFTSKPQTFRDDD